ncbi:UPF0568 protein, partial [Asbolus verrucosus]
MVKRLLSALNYPQCDSVNINDENTFRKIVIWLEQNKIKKANANLQNGLKNISSNDWPNSYRKYKEELGCPNLQTQQEQLQWLLGYAVQNETHSNIQSKDFADGISNVAKLLNITPHPNPLVTLKAVTKLVTTRLSPQAQANPSEFILK